MQRSFATTEVNPKNQRTLRSNNSRTELTSNRMHCRKEIKDCKTVGETTKKDIVNLFVQRGESKLTNKFRRIMSHLQGTRQRTFGGISKGDIGGGKERRIGGRKKHRCTTHLLLVFGSISRH